MICANCGRARHSKWIEKTWSSDSRGLDQKRLTSDILLRSEWALPCYRPHSCKNNMIWPSWNSKEGWPGREGGGGSTWGDPVIVLTASDSSQFCPKHWLIFLPDLFKIGLTKQFLQKHIKHKHSKSTLSKIRFNKIYLLKKTPKQYN